LFTGVIEEKGTVAGLTADGKLRVSARTVLEGTRIGDSIAVSGVCLTVVELDSSSFTVDVMPETLRSSALADVRTGRQVNLERAMGAGGRFGGHLVNGHVDGVGTVGGIRREANAVVIEISTPVDITHYMVPKGSVAIDGISLTIVEVSRGRFTISVIPHTLDETTLDDARAGTRVNLEVDIIAKYVESFLARDGTPEQAPSGGIGEALYRGGFTSGQEG
jgi:riboflavin synthase